MNVFQRLSFGLAGLLALSFLAVAAELAGNQVPAAGDNVKTMPVVRVLIDGNEYSAPLNENIKVSAARKQFDEKTIDIISEEMLKIVHLVVDKNAGYVKTLFSSRQLFSKLENSKSELKKLQKSDPTPPMAKGYGKKMGSLIKNILSIRTDEEFKKEQQVKDRIEHLLDAIKQMTAKSPAGLYMDWTEFKVNDEPLAKHVAPVLRWFREKGYGFALKCLSLFADLISFSI